LTKETKVAFKALQNKSITVRKQNNILGKLVEKLRLLTEINNSEGADVFCDTKIEQFVTSFDLNVLKSYNITHPNQKKALLESTKVMLTTLFSGINTLAHDMLLELPTPPLIPFEIIHGTHDSFCAALTWHQTLRTIRWARR